MKQVDGGRLIRKISPGLDLGFNIVTDVTMFTGEGEELRAADLAAEGGLDVAEHVGEDGGASLVDDLAEDCGGLSFSYTTVVATSVGSVSIGSLRPGNQVWAYNQQSKQMELEVVRHLWITQDNDLIDLTLTHETAASKGKPAQQTSETIHTNKKHPFLTVEKGFVPVGQLKLGMHIVESGGRVGVVTGWLSVPGTQVMYNLEVTRDHTYTVGAGQWVVHNTGRCINGGPQPVGDTKHLKEGRLEQLGIGAHPMKEANVDGPPSHWDTYMDKAKNMYLTEKRGGSINNLRYIGTLEEIQRDFPLLDE